MKKLFSGLHRWLALPFGIFIAISCLTGGLLAFEKEILEARYPERYFVNQTAEAPLPTSQIVERAQAQLPDSILITGIRIEKEPDRNYLLQVSKGDKYFVNPYTGDLAAADQRDDFFSKVIRLHRYCMQDYKKGSDEIPWGRWIMGTATLAFLFILLSGLVKWFPKNRQLLRHRLRVKCSSRFRFWHDLHVAGGFYAFLLLLLIAGTGLTWSFSWYRTPFYTLLGADHAEVIQKKERKKPVVPDTIYYQQWNKVVGELRQRYADFNTLTLEGDKVTVTYADYGNVKAQDEYKFDVTTGAITKTLLNADRTLYSRLRNWVFCLHTGSWGGIASRILYLLATLTALICVATGYYFGRKRTS